MLSGSGKGAGMIFEMQSILGPFLRISPIPDGLSKPQPSVQDTCFSGVRERRSADVLSAISSMRTTSEGLQGAMHGVFLNLLRCRKGELRERVLAWCARLLAMRLRTRVQRHYMIAAADRQGLLLSDAVA